MGVIFKELINASVTARDSKDVLEQVGKMFFENGFVKDTYVNAALEREKVFPTGLILKSASIAMPHTDSEHVNKPGICIAKLTNPVDFGHMGDPDTIVHANLIFMMAITNPSEQIDTLKKVMKVFQSEEASMEFKNARDNKELYEVAKKYLD